MAREIPMGMHTLTPHIVCRDAAAAIEFYKKAFGATEVGRLAGPDGKLMHGHVKIGDSDLMLVDEMPEHGARSPLSFGGTPCTIHMYTTDADAAWAKAIEAGATVVMPLADMFWGDRYGIVKDPFGHTWSIAHHIKDVSAEEIGAAMKG